MKCPICDGGGRITSLPSGMPVKCTRCNGTGEVEQTNEEWLRSCNTEQLAEKLTDFSFWLVPNYPTEDKREQIRKKIVEWLKQPHTFE